jgi:hypothetical protein
MVKTAFDNLPDKSARIGANLTDAIKKEFWGLEGKYTTI